ncbi:MAG TPA: F0F1 ATP synthase subunit beta, partial [Demequina sp.]|nr:F0F1 ATP synthase subunit beta [Demequina sp.]
MTPTAKTAPKAPASKTPAKKAPAKKTTAKKAPAKKTTAKKAPAESTPAAEGTAVGRVARVIGPVVDIEFPADGLPGMY